jgi:hypothetical protein
MTLQEDRASTACWPTGAVGGSIQPPLKNFAGVPVGEEEAGGEGEETDDKAGEGFFAVCLREKETPHEGQQAGGEEEAEHRGDEFIRGEVDEGRETAELGGCVDGGPGCVAELHACREPGKEDGNRDREGGGDREVGEQQAAFAAAQGGAGLQGMSVRRVDGTFHYYDWLGLKRVRRRARGPSYGARA